MIFTKIKHNFISLLILFCYSLQINADGIRNYIRGNNFINYFVSLNNESHIKEQSTCAEHLKLVELGIQRQELWALKFIDAWANVPAGVLYGHNVEMGNFDECLSVDEKLKEKNLRIRGKYCLANVAGAKFQNTNVVNLGLGICIPEACSVDEAKPLLAQFFETKWNISLNGEEVVLNENQCTEQEQEPLNPLDWVAVSILIILAVFMSLSTIYDYLKTNQEKNLNPLLASFSVRSNMRQLLRMTSSANTPKHIIPALNGIRVLSFIWIIYLHSFMMLVLSPNVNNADIIQWSQTLFFMVWKNGSIAVDSFFFLSGLLLISVAFREMEKKSGKLNIPLMYLHRFIRLSPVLYLAVLLFMTLFRFTGSGPIWNQFISSYHLCDDTWWATLLYVQNYAAAGRMCLGHSWYLAVDMQLYILSPIALILIWKWRRWGLAALLFIGLLLVVGLFSIVIIYDLIVFRSMSTPGSDSSEMRMTYYATHARVSPWIIGIIFGYYLHVNSGRRIVVPKIFVFLGWVLSMGLLLTVVFVLYPKTQADATLLTPLEGAFFISLSRIAWPLGLCWLVFACVNGYAGPINTFLSSKLWQPLAKLSYCMYIWHFLIVIINAGQIKTNSHFSNYDSILRFWSDFGITILVSTIMYLAIEAPMLGIEKFIFSKDNPKSGEENKPRPATTISQQNLVD